MNPPTLIPELTEPSDLTAGNFAAVQLALAGRLRERVDGPCAKFLFGAGAQVELVDALLPLFLRIRDRQGRLVLLRPNTAQQQYARRRTRRNIILKARQVGVTTYIAARFFLTTILRPGTVTLQVAHSLESAQQIFRIVHRFADHLHPDITRTVVTSRANVRELAFAALDSRYIVDTAGNRSAGRGLTIHNLHASEVALWPGDPQETMAALLGAVAPGGAVDLESSPHGAGGYFFSEWLRAKRTDGIDAGFTPHFFPWWIEPAYWLPLGRAESLEPLSEAERLLVEREQLAPEQIKYRRYLRATFGDFAPQEFAESDTECFIVSGRPVFDVAAIDARLQRLPRPLIVRSNGAEIVWLEPARGRNYVIGADVAEGGAEGDYSAAVVVDVETGLQCAELCARWPIHRFAEELARLGERYNRALVAVERNNHGHAVLYALEHQFNYTRLYRHRDTEPGSATKGWPMNARTKPQVIAALARVLREAPEALTSARLLEQCRNFAYGDDGGMNARAGLHDDLVIAAAIAFAVRARAGDPQLTSAEM
jgi:hypothetical protein